MMIDDAMTFVMFLKCQNDFSLAQWRHHPHAPRSVPRTDDDHIKKTLR
jgi:hypothetical protein